MEHLQGAGGHRRSVLEGGDVVSDPARNGHPAGGPDPWHLHALAWEYMLPERPMTRRVDTLEVHSARWGLKRMELDVSFPSSCLLFEAGPDGPPERSLIPAALIPKEPVAVDLEVRDCDGAWVAVPTRRECKGLTERAMGLISSHADSLLDTPRPCHHLDRTLLQRIGDVITLDPLRARVSRLHIEKRMGLAADVLDWLLPLLRRLEDNYLLWAPIEGSPLGDHHLSIRRSDYRKVNRIFPPCRPREVGIRVESAAGTIQGRWRPASRWRYTFSLSALLGRLLVSFGLMPVKFDEETLEADRFSSYHLCMVPPAGLVVREVKTGRIDESEWGREKLAIDELKTDLDRTVHGADTRTGHVHLEMLRNPAWLNSRITIGLRPGTTTLWATVVVLTCGLLWTLRHEVGRILGLDPDAELSQIDTQIVAAVLLVGPTLAASWTLKVNDPTLIRNMLGGTQALLLGSAILSVATALVLASIAPFGWGAEETIGWYGSVSYAIAVLIVTGWLQARSLVWLIYRKVLSGTAMNLAGTTVFASLAYVAARPLADVVVAPLVALLFAGFGMTAIAGNRTSVDLGKNSRPAAALAGFGALVALALAGRELEFYDQVVVGREDALAYGGTLLAAIGCLAGIWFAVLCTRAIVRYFKRSSGHGGEDPMEIPGATAVSEP